MKAAGAQLFAPPADEEAGEEPEESEDTAGGVDDLLGNAFDALSDGDREGFVRSMRAAINLKPE
jgi:hypothetical protein